MLKGMVLYRNDRSMEVDKVYDSADVVYLENLSQRADDKVLDFIKVNYKVLCEDTEENGETSFQYDDASYICKTGTENCEFEINIGLVPISESEFKSAFTSYYQIVKGMDWNDYEVSFLGDARVEVGDKLEFVDQAVLNVHELRWSWDGALECTVSSGSAISSGSSSGFSLLQILRR